MGKSFLHRQGRNFARREAVRFSGCKMFMIVCLKLAQCECGQLKQSYSCLFLAGFCDTFGTNHNTAYCRYGILCCSSVYLYQVKANMSMNTSLRFETAGTNEALIRSMNREKDRVMKDELLAEREKQLKRESDVNLKAEWSEGLEEASYRKRLKHEQSRVKSELSLANKAIVASRRAALRNLFEKEHELYEKELHAMGRAFYVKRV